MPSIDQVHGNAEVVATLERYLAHARQGKSSYVAIAICQEGRPKNQIACDFAGAVNMEPVAVEAVKILQQKLDSSILNCTLPPRDPDLDASYVCYNMTTAFVSYDFLAWLVDAEMTRVREKAPFPLKVAFWGGRDGRTGLNLTGRQKMLDGVVRPSLALIGAVEDKTALLGRSKELWVLRDVVAAARAGEPVPKFKARLSPPRMMLASCLQSQVTITLREAEHWPHRNSNIGAWLQFARYLEKRGEQVIFVRDTAKRDDSIPDFRTFPLASSDIHVRMALYESAKANLFVSNGPATLAWFSDRPWLMFLELAPDGHPYFANTPRWWRENMGIEAGGQFPWSAPNQRIVWKGDVYSNLVEAWEKYMV